MADTQVLDNGARIQYISGGETVFGYPFFIPPKKILPLEHDLCVFYTPVGETPDDSTDKILEGLGYTVQGAGLQNGGTITLLFPTFAGDSIIIIRDIPFEQLVLFEKSTLFRGETVDAVHNKETLLIQQVESTVKTRGVLYEAVEQLGVGQTTLPKLPANTGVGIPIWTTNSAGNLVAGICTEDPDCSTLRSELASELISAPGTDLIGTNVPGLGPQTLTFTLQAFVEKTVLADQDISTPGSDIVGTNIAGHGPLTLSALLLQLSQGDDSRTENLLLNGNFEFFQRGLSFNLVGGGVGEYVADKWSVTQTGGTTVTSRLDLNLAAIIGFSSNWALRIARTVEAGTNVVIIQQPIEDVHVANGRTISISVDFIKFSGTTIDIDLTWLYVFDGSTIQTNFLGTFTVSPGISNKQLVVQLPAFDPGSKVIGPNNHSVLRFTITNQGLYNFGMFNASCMLSGSFHRFIPRARGIELAGLQRFYNKSYPVDDPPGFSLGRERSIFSNIRADQSQLGQMRPGFSTVFPSPMRVLPTVQLFTPDAGTPGRVLIFFEQGADIGEVIPLTFIITENQFSFTAFVNSGITDGVGGVSFNYTADAEYTIV